jgi:hypothetical protein
MSKKSFRTRKAAVLIGGIGILGVTAVLASAASLGTISQGSLGSGIQVVASCDTDGVTVSYTNAYDPTSGHYKVSSVTIGGINTACVTKNLAITLKDSASGAGNSVGTGSGVVTVTLLTPTQTFAITGNTDAALVLGAAVVIAD